MWIMIAIPITTVGIAVLFKLCISGECLFDMEPITQPIKNIYCTIRDKYREYTEKRLLHEIVTDPKTNIMYYRNDGLTRDFTSSP
jgi:hypothetical protein